MDRVREAGGPAKLIVLFLTVWVGCGLIGSAVIWGADYRNQRLYSTLGERGVVVGAVVTATDPGDHNRVFYSFFAGGTAYSSSDSSWPPNPLARELAVGDELYVVYDSANPNASCACDPHKAAVAGEWWRNLIGGMFLGQSSP
jgi:hypothetical protein